MEALRANEIAGVTVYRGILGYGANRRIHKDKTLSLSHHRPIMLAVIDTEAKLAAFTPILDQMLQQGLVVLSDVDVIKYTHDYKGTDRRAGGAKVKLEGKAKMLRIHFGEDDKWQGKPLYRAIVEKCRELDIAGATVYRGIEGYGASTLIHRSHLLSFLSDAPIMISIVDTDENVQKLIPTLDQMVDEGLIPISDVEVIKYVHQEGVQSEGNEFRSADKRCDSPCVFSESPASGSLPDSGSCGCCSRSGRNCFAIASPRRAFNNDQIRMMPVPRQNALRKGVSMSRASDSSNAASPPVERFDR